MVESSFKKYTQQNYFAVTSLIILTIVVFVIYQNGLHELVSRWNKQEEYSYGYFIPIIALYIIFSERNKVLSEKENPSWLGVIITLVALFILVIGELSAIYIFTQYSFVILLLGLTSSLFGNRVLKKITIPIIILLFSIPLPYFIESELTWKLQLVSSELGVDFIRLLGIPVFLEGNIIDLGTYKLQVIEACSGLNYLYPLMSIGFIVAYIFKAPLLYRSIIFLSTIPITIIMNSLRIGMVGILVSYSGIKMAEGFMHYFEGWLIFLACLGILIFEIYLLTRIMPNKPKLDTVLAIRPNIKESYPKKLRLRLSSPFILTSILIVFSAFSITQLSNRTEVSPDRVTFDKFPDTFNKWQLIKSKLTPSIIQKLQFDDYFLGNYVKGSNTPIELYIAFYNSQRKGVSPHSPRVCIPGGGWHIKELNRKVIKLKNNYILPVNRLIIEKNKQKKLVYYWFQQRDRSIANEYLMKWYLLQDAIFKNRTDGALVRFTADVNVNNTEFEAENQIRELINLVYPVLNNYVPN